MFTSAKGRKSAWDQFEEDADDDTGKRRNCDRDCGAVKGDLGFPVPENIRDVLPNYSQSHSTNEGEDKSDEKKS